MQDTGQHIDPSRLLHELVQRESQIYQLQAQLRHFHSWTACLASTALQPLSMPVMLAAIQVIVSGFPEGTTERELALFFNDLIAANRAAVAPGPAVSDCKLLRGSKGVALVELRCAVEASNCMAFDGVLFKRELLTVQRPREYRPDAAVLLGPCQPDPAVVAAVSNTAQQQHHRGPPLAAAAAGDKGQYSSYPSAATSAQWTPGYVNNYHCSNTSSVSNHPARYGAAAGSDTAAYSNGSKMQGMPVAASAAAQDEAGHAGPGGSSSSCSAAAQDLAPSADQGKRDEVFIGGLPSHWKAQQVKELLAPYGQLKSLSVAMDAATGKNKGYAFVVFADTLVVPRAIEELDCKVVEGKILAVQRATEGKASACAASLGKDITSSNGHYLSLVASSNSNFNSSSRCAYRGPGSNLLQHKQLQHLQQQQRHHRISSGSSSGSSNGACFPSAAGTYAHEQPSSIHPIMQQQQQQPMQQQQQMPYPAAAAPAIPPPAAAQQLPGPPAPRPATAPLPPGDGAALGQRLLAAVTAGAAASAAAAGGPACARQYDVNELYIGDLPLSWDEDAVRRMLGRYGKIKYFTLRNGRDKNFAFCKFKDSSVVDAAIQGLHGKIVDGYFLNVRRAIEGKQQQQQQHQQQRQWQGRQSMGGPMGSPPLPAAAAAAMPGRMMCGASRFGQLQAGPQKEEQQQQLLKGQLTTGALSAAAATPTNGVDAIEPAEDQQQQQEEEAVKVSAEIDTRGTGAGAGQQQPQQQQRASTSTSSTAPSPPRTPTAADLQQQQLLPQQELSQQQQQQAAVSAVKEQSNQALPPIPQQQQQQGSLFLNSSGPASWGAPGLFTSAYQQQQQQQSQQQSSSLLQTWDMLSPWSLFSGSAPKVQW